jgi:uncharacterized protein with HEPN domain
MQNSIESIESFTAGMDFEDFRSDPKTVAAVERMLLVISEAAIRLGDHAATLCPGVPWPHIRGIGNALRHGYDRVDLESIWSTVTDDLPPLKAAVSGALQRLPQPVPPEPL